MDPVLTSALPQLHKGPRGQITVEENPATLLPGLLLRQRVVVKDEQRKKGIKRTVVTLFIVAITFYAIGYYLVVTKS